jgi:glutamate--cysteine ligase
MLTIDDLVADMASGCKPKKNWRIGIEHEQFVFDKRTGENLPYEGQPGIKAILERLIERHGWQPGVYQGHLIALSKGMQTVTLEPGGQVEYSSSPLATMADVRAEADAFYSDLHDVTHVMSLSVLPVGFHPVWRREDIHRMPKERYGIMKNYMEKVGKLGLDMMLRTCGAQINLDFDSEADMVKKYRVSLGLQPVITALLANSTRVEGKPSGYACYRSHIWTDTDKDRCGVPAFVFEDGMGFARYVEYALDVPMYFIIRDGHYVDVSGQSFRAFMNGKLPGREGEYPSLDDWHDHLTTLFPEVRLKKYLELRGADSVPPPLVYAMMAFWVAIFYDADALDQAYGLIEQWPAENHIRLRDEVPREGLDAMLPHGQHLRNLALEALEIADLSLARTGEDNHARGELALLFDKAQR